MDGIVVTVVWEVEYTDEFEAWWNSLSEDEQVEIAARLSFYRNMGQLYRVLMLT